MTCPPFPNSFVRIINSLDAMEIDDETVRFYGDLGDEEIVDDDERCAGITDALTILLMPATIPACSSFGNGLGILSNDHDAETSYVSTQMPMNYRLCQVVKHSCLRSLSVEISTPLYIDTAETSSSYFSGMIKLPRTYIRYKIYSAYSRTCFDVHYH